MNKPNKPSVYLRCSSRSQDLESQRPAIRRYLEGQGLAVPTERWFEDEGKSGKNLDRPGLKRLDESIFHGETDCVIMFSLDRFARVMIHGMQMLDKWQRAGVKLVFVSQGLEIDPTELTGQLILKIMCSMLLGFAELERDRILVRQQAGIDQAVARANTLRKLRQNNPHLDIKVIARMAGYKRISHAQYVLDHPYSKTHWGGRPKGARKVKGLTADKLQEYLDRGFTVAEIAKIHKVVRSTVYDWMDKLGLKRDEEEA
jgi:DNA invertase Pin-like site-specific DNA recombinase